MKNNGVKFRFPHGQWCTAMEKISEEKSKQEFFAVSFFDQNIAIVSDEVQRFQYNPDSYESPVATETPLGGTVPQNLTAHSASNLSDQINCMSILPKPLHSSQTTFTPSSVFISDSYL
jgi:hypothetical protein